MSRIFTLFGGITGVNYSIAPPPVAGVFALEQNYPNPFNPTTAIRYHIAGTAGQGSGAGRVKLAIYDVLGREVALLVDGVQEAGLHELFWDARNVASGVYYYRLTAGASVATRTMTVLK